MMPAPDHLPAPDHPAVEDQAPGLGAALDAALADPFGPMPQDERASVIFTYLAHHARRDGVAVAAACDVVLENLRRGLPAPVFAAAAPLWSDARAEAQDWAQHAADWQVAAMLCACLDRVGGARVPTDDRKALMAALWRGLPEKEQRAFVARVDPRGTARVGAGRA